MHQHLLKETTDEKRSALCGYATTLEDPRDTIARDACLVDCQTCLQIMQKADGTRAQLRQAAAR